LSELQARDPHGHGISEHSCGRRPRDPALIERSGPMAGARNSDGEQNDLR
jgi:hypothetical protein